MGRMITVRDMSKNDELWTPPSAVRPILDHVGHADTVWEMCPGSGQMVEYMKEEGYDVWSMAADGLTHQPQEWDVIITNPPWSKKHLFLERCVKLGRPFALLLPIRTLGVRRCQIWMDKVSILFLSKRVDFTGGGAPYEACAWFTKYLLPERMMFE